jgi:hypothetical protein
MSSLFSAEGVEIRFNQIEGLTSGIVMGIQNGEQFER